MSGPIVRSGPSEKFTTNWGKAFAGGKSATKAGAEKKSAPKSKKKATSKPKKKGAKKS
jgi:hypothetical protein